MSRRNSLKLYQSISSWSLNSGEIQQIVFAVIQIGRMPGIGKNHVLNSAAVECVVQRMHQGTYLLCSASVCKKCEINVETTTR